MEVINYNATNKVERKSVPMFPKGINRDMAVDNDGLGDIGLQLDLTDNVDDNTDKSKDTTVLDNVDNQGKINDPAAAGASDDNNNDDNSNNVIDFSTDTFKVTEEGLLNSKGEVVKTLDQLETEGYLDNKGNVINPTTKEVVLNTEDNTNNSNDLSVVAEVAQTLGYEILDETGKPKVYEDSTKGIADYTLDVAKRIAETTQKEFFEANPEVKAFARHLAAGGNRDSFFNYTPKDYANVDVTTLDAEQKANLILDDYIASGIPKERALKLVESHKKNNEIDEYVTDALGNLVNRRKEFETKEEQRVIELRQKEEADNTAYWSEVTNKVKAGVLNNISIPVADKDGFLAYISKPVNDKGLTQNALDASKEDVNYQLQIAYMRYKKYDLSTLSKSEVKKAQAASLRERLAKDKGANIGNNATRETINDNTGKVGTSVSLENIDR